MIISIMTTMEIKKKYVNNRLMCENEEEEGEQKGTDAFAMVDRIRRVLEAQSVMQPNPLLMSNVYYITIDSYPKCDAATPLLIPF